MEWDESRQGPSPFKLSKTKKFCKSPLLNSGKKKLKEGLKVT